MNNKLILAGMLAVSACLVTNAFAHDLRDTTWDLYAIDGKSTTGAKLQFKEKQLFGKFCNNFSTSYEYKEGLLKTEPLAITQMLCEDSVMTNEINFNPSNAKVAFLSGDMLTLTQTNGHTYEWKKSKTEAEKKSHFDKGEWKLVAFNGKTAVTGATLSFSGDWLSAKFCNRMSGNYEPRGGKIKSEGLMKTLMLCEGELGKYEDAFSIENASYETTKEGKLLITTVKGDSFLWEPLVADEQKKPQSDIQEEKVFALLDTYFATHQKAFPTKKEKITLMKRLVETFSSATQQASGELKAQYQSFLTILEQYLTKLQ